MTCQRYKALSSSPALLFVIPALLFVIPALLFVIPAKAKDPELIHFLDSRFRGNDEDWILSFRGNDEKWTPAAAMDDKQKRGDDFDLFRISSTIFLFHRLAQLISCDDIKKMRVVSRGDIKII